MSLLPRPRWPTASLWTYLSAAMLLAVLPMAVLMGTQRIQEIRGQQARMEDELAGSAAALAASVDRQLRSSIEGLQVLAQSELFQQGRVAALGRLLHGRPRGDWDSIFLLDRQGAMVLDTGQPRGKAGSEVLRNLHREVLRGAPAVSGLWEQAPGHRWTAVAVPIVQNGQVRYVLGARMDESVWQWLSTNTRRPGAAKAEVFDGQGRLLGASTASVPRGGALPPEGLADMARASAGVHRSRDLDGSEVYAAWRTSAMSGWQARVAVPAGPIDAAGRRAIGTALATTGGSLLLGLLLAALVARRIARPLRQLAAGGGTASTGHVPVREVAALRDALAAARERDAAAQATLQAATQEFEAEVAARQQAQERLLLAERQLAMAQETGHLGCFHYLFEGDRLWWSPGHATLFGGGALPQGRFADWLERVAEEDRERIEREFWTACALHRERLTLEYGVRRPDGSTCRLSSRVLLEYDPAGRAVRLVGVTFDLTDQVTSQRALAAQQEAQAASRAKDEFLSLLAHELRNPLGAISAAADVLETAPSDGATAAEARSIIGRQTRQLAHLLGDLLEVGRVLAGKVLLARQPVDLAALVQRADEAQAPAGKTAAHPLELRLAPAWVDADPARLEQLVNKLLASAIKPTPAGRSIRVAVSCDGEMAVLEVDGPDRDAGALDVGLTLVRRLAELHGGTLEVHGLGEGIRFTVRLPAIAAPDVRDDAALPPGRRRQVLVVEDNGDVLASLRAKLEQDGHSVSTAADGVEGLQCLLRLKPEVSIVDIGLPGLTGFQLARQARAAGYAGRMIAMSGWGAERDAREALVAGFDAYLLKPIDRQQLRASLGAE